MNRKRKGSYQIGSSWLAAEYQEEIERLTAEVAHWKRAVEDAHATYLLGYDGESEYEMANILEDAMKPRKHA